MMTRVGGRMSSGRQVLVMTCVGGRTSSRC
jgi:hypothetical protein